MIPSLSPSEPLVGISSEDGVGVIVFSVTVVDDDDIGGGGGGGVGGGGVDFAVSVDEDDGDGYGGGGGLGNNGWTFSCLRCCKLSVAAASISEDGALDKSSRLMSYPLLPITLPCEGVLDIANPS